MGHLTREERRRVFLVQEKARRTMLTSLASAQTTPRDPRAPRRWQPWLLRAAIIATLLTGGWFAYHAVEFHAPASIVEALLPRL